VVITQERPGITPEIWRQVIVGRQSFAIISEIYIACDDEHIFFRQPICTKSLACACPGDRQFFTDRARSRCISRYK